MRELGVLTASSESFREIYRLMLELTLGVLRTPGPSTISKETLTGEMMRFLPSQVQLARELQMPPAYTYGFRMYWGMFAIVADLGARVRFREVTLDALERWGDDETRRAAFSLRRA
jgi:hypothetical protein